MSWDISSRTKSPSPHTKQVARARSTRWREGGRVATRYNWMADTDPKAFEVLIELLRKMSPGDKLACVLNSSALWMRIAEDHVRKLYPEASDREVFLRSAAR